MNLLDLKITEFIDAVDSNSPTPGGGSVSALASTLGIALAKMVGHLTVTKKKFNQLESEIQKTYHHNLNQLEDLKNKMKAYVDKDTQAYNQIMVAFRLPKETAEEKTHRNKQIETATIYGTQIPFEVAALSLEALALSEKLIFHANKNAISDIGVGALLLYAGLEGAVMNVKINLSGIQNQDKVNFYLHATEQLLSKAKSMKDSVVDAVMQVIN